MRLIDKLKRHAVVSWSLAYLATAFAAVQVFDEFAGRLGVEAYFGRLIWLLSWGFVVTVVLASYHGRSGRTRIGRIEIALLGLIVVGAAATLRFARVTTGHRGTDDPAAWEAYQTGKTLLSRSVDRARVDTALLYLEQAVDRDPDFTEAWAALARAAAVMHGDRLRTDGSGIAARALGRAVELDARSADTRVAQGYHAYYVDRDYDEALLHFAAARQLAPADPDRALTEGFIRRRRGEWTLAVEAFLEAEREAPSSYQVKYVLGQAYRDMGDYSRADDVLERAIPLSDDPRSAHAQRLLLRLLEGDTVGARMLAERYASALDPGVRRVFETTLAFYRNDLPTALDSLRGLPYPDEDAWGGFVWPGYHSHTAVTAFLAGDTAWARREADDALDKARVAIGRLDPSAAGTALERSAWLAEMALAWVAVGDHAAALTAADSAVTLLPVADDAFTGPHRLWTLARVLALAGQRAKADTVVDRVLALEGKTYSRAFAELDPFLRGPARRP